MKQISMQQYGAPEVLQLIETEIPTAKAGEVIIKVEAIGVNYSDVLRRQNKYFQPTPLPFVLGAEAVGQIVAVGEGVDESYAIGTTVLAILPYGGGYSEYVAAIAQYCVVLPPNIDAKTATAIFVQGSTAQLLVTQAAKDINGKTVLVNAAAGGVGSLIVQLAKLNGAKVIATASTDSKLQIAKQCGADVLINYSETNWSEKVKQATENKGVDIVFEMVGGETYNQSIKSLSQGGQLVVYGAASGEQGNIHPEYFVDENITQTGFNLAYYITQKTNIWQEALGTLIGLMAQGKIKANITHTYPLKDVAIAHDDIEKRKTTGKVVLTVN